jgi:hypothetical protein
MTEHIYLRVSSLDAAIRVAAAKASRGGCYFEEGGRYVVRWEAKPLAEAGAGKRRETKA